MYMLGVFGVGFYSITLWPFHIPMWCTGHLIQHKVKSQKGRMIFLGILAAGLIICEMLCQWILTGYACLVPAIIMLCIWDLLFGYFAKPIYRLLRKLFRSLIDWIYAEEETNHVE